MRMQNQCADVWEIMNAYAAQVRSSTELDGDHDYHIYTQKT